MNKTIICLVILPLFLFSCGENLSSYIKKGDKHAKDGDLENAKIYYNKALAADPSEGAAHLGLAQIYIVQGDKDSALAELKKASSLKPENATYHYYLGNLFFNLQMYDDSILELTKAVNIDPNQPEYIKKLGRVYYIGKKDFADAEKEFLKAFQMGDKRSGELLIDLYCKYGRFQEAVDILDKYGEDISVRGIVNSPKDITVNWWTKELSNVRIVGNVHLGKHLFDIVEITGKSFGIKYGMLDNYITIKDIHLSSPANAEELFYYAETLKNNGRTEEAKKAFDDLIAKYPGSPFAEYAKKKNK